MASQESINDSDTGESEPRVKRARKARTGQSRSFDVLVYGSINTDLTMVTERLPQAGETLTAQSFSQGTGGKGANQAVAISRMSRSRRDGIQFRELMDTKLAESSTLDDISMPLLELYQHDDIIVNMVGAVGHDPFGIERAKEIAMEHIFTFPIHEVEASTGIANIIVEKESGENRILLFPGANSLIETKTTLQGIDENYYNLLVVDLEVPLVRAMEVMKHAHNHGMKIVFNPSPAIKNIPREAIEIVSYLIVNETEAAILSERDVAFVEDESNLSATADLLLEKGAETVIITLGGRGSYFKQRVKGETSDGRVQASKVGKVVDTTGAGDTFLGAFVYQLAMATASKRNLDHQYALRWASVAAALSVQRPGAMASIPYGDEVNEAFMMNE
ncbi:MAG: hypothetical protein M1814_005708 [Vezdaea aestivalis]|nr:MAG: hypothetical protein M1814_005708 [Vezdaea aestivalis]